MRSKRIRGSGQIVGPDQAAQVSELVQDRLEPQLRGLKHGHEHHFIVHACPLRLLQLQQRVQAEKAGVVVGRFPLQVSTAQSAEIAL